MIYRKLISFSLALCVVNVAYSQKLSKKRIEKNFMVGVCYNALNSTNNTDISGIIRTPIEYRRDWQFDNQPSVTLGLNFKNQLTKWFATQLELNLLTTRQKAIVDEAISVNNNKYTTVGTIDFSTLYVYIPVIFGIKVEKNSDFEFGISTAIKIQNWGSQDLIRTVFSEQKECNICGNVNPNPITTFAPAKIVNINDSPKLFNNNLGALVGVNYRFSKNNAVRLRYERDLQYATEFSDLFQSRLSLSFLFKWQ
jgi:hypothetical protein